MHPNISCITYSQPTQERKVSPPDLPPKDMYTPLGRLLEDVANGIPFTPISPNDIQHFNTHGALPPRPSSSSRQSPAASRGSSSTQGPSSSRQSPVASVTAAELSAAGVLFGGTDGMEYYYLDKQERIQGPFAGEKMVRWFEEGWLKRALHVAAAVCVLVVCVLRVCMLRVCTHAFNT